MKFNSINYSFIFSNGFFYITHKFYLLTYRNYLPKNHHTKAVVGPKLEVPTAFAASLRSINFLPPDEDPSLILLPSLMLHKHLPPDEEPSLISLLLLMLPRHFPPNCCLLLTHQLRFTFPPSCGPSF